MFKMDGNFEFLKAYQCSTELYHFIQLCKKRHGFQSVLPLETSVKTYTDGRVEKGRYTLAISLVEFLRYEQVEQEVIFQALGFNRADFTNHLTPSVSGNTDIILGQDGQKGKIYFDYLDRPWDPHLICYESTGKIKYYRMKVPPNRLYIYDINGSLIGVHIRINGEEGIYWYGISANYTTLYFRREL
jgi:hypothetical protein